LISDCWKVGRGGDRRGGGGKEKGSGYMLKLGVWKKKSLHPRVRGRNEKLEERGRKVRGGVRCCWFGYEVEENRKR